MINSNSSLPLYKVHAKWYSSLENASVTFTSPASGKSLTIEKRYMNRIENEAELKKLWNICEEANFAEKSEPGTTFRGTRLTVFEKLFPMSFEDASLVLKY